MTIVLDVSKTKFMPVGRWTLAVAAVERVLELKIGAKLLWTAHVSSVRCQQLHVHRLNVTRQSPTWQIAQTGRDNSATHGDRYCIVVVNSANGRAIDIR